MLYAISIQKQIQNYKSSRRAAFVVLNYSFQYNGLFINTRRLSCHCGSDMPRVCCILSLHRTEYADRIAFVGYSTVAHGCTARARSPGNVGVPCRAESDT
jgi:hypothetical protein